MIDAVTILYLMNVASFVVQLLEPKFLVVLAAMVVLGCRLNRELLFLLTFLALAVIICYLCGTTIQITGC